MSEANPDRITLEESYFEEVAAIGAKLDLVIKGTFVFSENAAFAKQKNSH